MKKQVLGKKVQYKDTYDPKVLVPINRKKRRRGYKSPMYGYDLWTAYEVSYLDPNGLPRFCILRMLVPAHSTNTVESKSLKLYLNSLNNTTFTTTQDIVSTITRDLSKLAKEKVIVGEFFPSSLQDGVLRVYDKAQLLESTCKDVSINVYKHSKELLKALPVIHKKYTVYSNLLRTNCEITGQPDWGRIRIEYIPDENDGMGFSYYSLLQYIVSYRNHREFHEPTCERIFNDLYSLIAPKYLSVICQYTRRGGIDINPVRVSKPIEMDELTLYSLPKIAQQ